MEIAQLADLLFEAEASHKAISPLSDIIGKTDLDLAYKIQDYNITRKVKAGAKIVGKKIGCTNDSIQSQLGIEQPDYGILLDSMAIENGASFSVQKMMQPKAEAEIAFVVSKDIDEDGFTEADLKEYINHALPAIEIVGSRIANWKIQITDTIADNASASHFIIGTKAIKLEDLDLTGCKMNMTKNGVAVSSGTGADCLGSPLTELLLNRFSTKLRIPIKFSFQLICDFRNSLK